MPNRFGPKRFSPPLSTVWQIAHCRMNAALPLAGSLSASAALAPRQPIANVAPIRQTAPAMNQVRWLASRLSMFPPGYFCILAIAAGRNRVAYLYRFHGDFQVHPRRAELYWP